MHTAWLLMCFFGWKATWQFHPPASQHTSSRRINKINPIGFQQLLAFYFLFSHNLPKKEFYRFWIILFASRVDSIQLFSLSHLKAHILGFVKVLPHLFRTSLLRIVQITLQKEIYLDVASEMRAVWCMRTFSRPRVLVDWFWCGCTTNLVDSKDGALRGKYILNNSFAQIGQKVN